MQLGKTFGDLDISDDIADGFPLGFRVVDDKYYRDYLGYALWFYESFDFPVLQCVWPDNSSRFPWDDNCDTGCRRVQVLTQSAG